MWVAVVETDGEGLGANGGWSGGAGSQGESVSLSPKSKTNKELTVSPDPPQHWHIIHFSLSLQPNLTLSSLTPPSLTSILNLMSHLLIETAYFLLFHYSGSVSFGLVWKSELIWVEKKKFSAWLSAFECCLQPTPHTRTMQFSSRITLGKKTKMLMIAFSGDVWEPVSNPYPSN